MFHYVTRLKIVTKMIPITNLINNGIMNSRNFTSILPSVLRLLSILDKLEYIVKSLFSKSNNRILFVCFICLLYKYKWPKPLIRSKMAIHQKFSNATNKSMI